MAAVDVFNGTTSATTSDAMPFGQNSPEQSLTTSENNSTAKLFEALDGSNDSSSLKGSLEGSDSSVDDSVQICTICE